MPECEEGRAQGNKMRSLQYRKLGVGLETTETPLVVYGTANWAIKHRQRERERENEIDLES